MLCRPLDEKTICFIQGQITCLDESQYKVFRLTEFKVVVQSAAFKPCPPILEPGDPISIYRNSQDGTFARSEAPALSKFGEKLDFHWIPDTLQIKNARTKCILDGIPVSRMQNFVENLVWKDNRSIEIAKQVNSTNFNKVK